MSTDDDHRTNVPIVVQLRLTFVIILLVIGVIVMHSLWQFQGWKLAQQNLARESVPTVLLARDHREDIATFTELSKRLVSHPTGSGDPGQRQEWLSQLDELNTQLTGLSSLNSGGGLKLQIAEQRNILDQHVNLIDKVIGANDTLSRQNAQDQSKLNDTSAILVRGAEALAERAKTILASDSKQIESEASGFYLSFSLSAIAGTFVIAFAASRLVEQRINRRVSRLTHLVLEIADGRLDEVIDLSGKDEIGKMARALEIFKENAMELRRSNNELEKFAYVAAHDLRSPLRAVQDLAAWTIEDPDNKLSDDSREYLHLLMARVGRLAKLLADLLEYSRIGQEAASVSAICVEETAQSIVEMVDVDRQFSLEYTGLKDDVTTYQVPLRQILLNLISNAIKHHDRAHGTLFLQCRRENDRILLNLRDDGPGIPNDYHEKIFELFQTLKSRDEVEGSGLGLAIVSKVLTHYRCNFKIVSDPGQRRGTAFEFDFPIV